MADVFMTVSVIKQPILPLNLLYADVSQDLSTEDIFALCERYIPMTSWIRLLPVSVEPLRYRRLTEIID